MVLTCGVGVRRQGLEPRTRWLRVGHPPCRVVPSDTAVCRFRRSQLLPAAESADGHAIVVSDVWGVSRPGRHGAGRGLVVGVVWWSLGCRWCGGQSAVTSVTAVRVEDSSTMALSAANAATRAWTARLLTARG